MCCSQSHFSIEDVFIRLHLSPPSSRASWMELFEEGVKHLLSFNMPVVLVGDFNMDLFKKPYFAHDIKAQHALLQIINEPTGITKINVTLLDYIYISKDIAVRNKGAFQTHLSVHHATYLQIKNFRSVDINRALSTMPTQSYRCLKNLKSDALLKDLALIPWHTIHAAGCINDALSIFEGLLVNV